MAQQHLSVAIAGSSILHKDSRAIWMPNDQCDGANKTTQRGMCCQNSVILRFHRLVQLSRVDMSLALFALPASLNFSVTLHLSLPPSTSSFCLLNQSCFYPYTTYDQSGRIDCCRLLRLVLNLDLRGVLPTSHRLCADLSSFRSLFVSAQRAHRAIGNVRPTRPYLLFCTQ